MGDEDKDPVGQIAVWDTYNDQPNPLYVLNNKGDWQAFTITDLAQLIYMKGSVPSVFK